jgi:ribosome maturation factor RimP
LDIHLEVHLTDTAAIARLIEPAVKGLGFDLVRVAMIGGTSDPTLQVMAERADTRQLTIDDCANISRSLSDLLDAEEAAGRDPIEGGYRLEVSSPGIDRPLTRRADFADWAGHEVRIKYAEPVDGAKQVSGIIEGISGDTIKVATPKGERQVEFANIASAKLLLTDKLINATAPLSTHGADLIKTEG